MSYQEYTQLHLSATPESLFSSIAAPRDHQRKLIMEMKQLRLYQDQVAAQLNAYNGAKDDSNEPLLSESQHWEAIGSLNRDIKQQEDELRKLFVTSTDTEDIVKQGNNLLVRVYEEEKSFEPRNDWVTNFPKIPVLNSRSTIPQQKIVSKDTFIANWSALTQDVFKDMEWSNLFVAGGSVLGKRARLNYY